MCFFTNQMLNSRSFSSVKVFKRSLYLGILAIGEVLGDIKSKKAVHVCTAFRICLINLERLYLDILILNSHPIILPYL